VAGDRDVRVTGDRDHRRLAAVAGDVDEDDRVGPLPLGRPAAVELLLLLRSEALAAVGADQQVVVPAVVDRPLTRRVVVHASDAVPCVDGHPDEERHPQKDDDENRDENVAAGPALAGRSLGHGDPSGTLRGRHLGRLPRQVPAGLQRRQGTLTRGAPAERAPRVDDIATAAVVDGAGVVSVGHSGPWSHGVAWTAESADVPRPQAHVRSVGPGPAGARRPDG
jgi:hypothetical protein